METTINHPPRFTWRAKLLVCLLLPSLVAALYALSPETAGVPVLLLLTPTIFAWHVIKNSSISMELLWWSAYGAGTLGVAGAAAVQGLLAHALRDLHFGDQAEEIYKESKNMTIDGLSDADLHRRTQIFCTWQYLAYIVIYTYIVAGFLEEIAKHFAVAVARKFLPEKLTELDYVNLVITGTLGFSTVENICYVANARDLGPAKVVGAVIGRIALSTPLHVLAVCLTALATVRRDNRGEQVSFMRMFGPPTLLHGTFDFLLFMPPAWFGVLVGAESQILACGAVVLLGIIGTLVLAFLLVRREMARLGLNCLKKCPSCDPLVAHNSDIIDTSSEDSKLVDPTQGT